MAKKWKRYVGDFETTVYEGQEYTSVWASGLVEIGTEDVEIYGSIDETWERLQQLVDKHGNTIVYYHNLKFDGEFWLSYFHSIDMPQAYDAKSKKFMDDWKMPPGSYKYVISDKGQWYFITVRLTYGFLMIRDSLKLLPFSVDKLGKSFGTKHRKLDIIYEGERYPNCYISQEEKDYLKNDLLVVKEALEIMFKQGHDRLTIGSCCLAEYKRTFFTRQEYEELFPNLYKLPLPKKYGASSIGEYVFKSYGGGWCFLVPGKARKNLHDGLTADVNSLYPGMMHSNSGNRYPVGKPIFWIGDIPDKALNKFYFVRFRCRFYLKSDKLPFVHIRRDYNYNPNENLFTSDHYHKETKTYHSHIELENGEKVSTAVELTMAGIEFELFLQHYDVLEFEVIDGCYFETEIGLFDEYIDKYKKIKMNSTGAIRESAKLFSNNLYGKLAMTTNSSFKVVHWKEDESVGFTSVEEYEKTPGYIPCGSAITAYARRFTITAATKNYHGVDKPGFAYADTDSIHCDGIKEAELIGVPIHDTEYGYWKIESHWDLGRFIRQKTYLERINGEVKVTCAGMPQRSKDIFIRSLTKDITKHEGDTDEKIHYILQHQDYILKGNCINKFDVGLVVPGKLFPRHVKGGIVLKEGDYNIK